MNFNQDFINLLQSLKPFLGPTAKSATEMTLHITNLITSPPGQLALQAFSSLTPQADAQVMPLDAQTNSLVGTNPFSLFLVLILLIFASQDYSQPPCQPEPKREVVEKTLESTAETEG